MEHDICYSTPIFINEQISYNETSKYNADIYSDKYYEHYKYDIFCPLIVTDSNSIEPFNYWKNSCLIKQKASDSNSWPCKKCKNFIKD